MTFRAKLLLAQAPLGVMLVLACALAVMAISTLGSHSQTILKDNYRSVLAAQRMQEAAERLEDSAVLGLLQERRDTTRQPPSLYLQKFEQELQAQEGNITEPGEQELTRQLRVLWNDYRQKLFRLDGIEDPKAAFQFYSTELKVTFDALRAAAEALLAINQDSMVRKSEAVRAHATRTNGLAIAGAIGALSFGLFFSTLLTDRLLRPLAFLGQVVRRIGAGDFQARVETSGHDEIAQLAREFNAMASSLAEYRNSSLGELLHAQEALQTAIDSLPDPVVTFGVAGDVRNVNRAADTLLGLSLGSVTRDPLLDADPDVRTVLERLRTHVLGGKGAFVPKGFEEALRLPTREGDKYFLPRATPVYEMGGALVGVTTILQEVTRLRRFDDLKNDLVATVAHEFRTPLTSLRMAIHLCLEQLAGPVTEKQADLLHAAREDCERLQTMVDDLLDLSRLESGRVKLQPQLVSLAALAQSVVAEQQALAEEHGVLVSVTAPAVEREVSVDPEQIALALSNLLANAIRHTPAGGSVEIRTRLTDGHLRCEVIDTGEGIPEEYRERIFDKFFRAPTASSGGAGLGLSIAKEIVQGHEGEIGVESEVGRGSTFWFTLPLVPVRKSIDTTQAELDRL